MPSNTFQTLDCGDTLEWFFTDSFAGSPDEVMNNVATAQFEQHATTPYIVQHAAQTIPHAARYEKQPSLVAHVNDRGNKQHAPTVNGRCIEQQTSPHVCDDLTWNVSHPHGEFSTCRHVSYCVTHASISHISNTTPCKTSSSSSGNPNTCTSDAYTSASHEQQPNKKRKNDEKPENSKRKKEDSSDKEEDNNSQEEQDSDIENNTEVKRISSSATYLELEPSGKRIREIIVSIYKSRRNQYGPRADDVKEFVRKMKFIASTKPNETTYVNTKGFLTKQYLLPQDQKTKVALWAKFEGSDDYFHLYCQTGKGESVLMNLLTFNRDDQLIARKHVNLNRYSNDYVKPSCEFIDEEEEDFIDF